MATTRDLRYRDVINICDGSYVGCVSDVEIDTCSATVTSLVLSGRSRFWGFFWRGEEVKIPWTQIKVIGEDSILVDVKADDIE